jgi:hypothetical protein
MSKKISNKIDPTTKQLLIAAQKEGLGSIYERVMLQDLLPAIFKKTKAKSVLEFPATITKGWDNHVLLDDYLVTVADYGFKLREIWPFKKKPRFVAVNKDTGKFDLVWNFALFHQHKKMFPAIDLFSKRYILLFTPNIFNWGAPLHWAFHLVTGTGCKHPENGPVNLMTAGGLADFVEKKGYTVIETGYFDMPPWPDFAFSKVELGKHFPFSLLWSKEKLDAQEEAGFDYESMHETIQKSAHWERKGMPRWMQAIIAHHQYVLAEKV